jgi:ELWxxDGT repeat protein
MIRNALGVVLLLLLGGVRATESGAPAAAGPAVLVHDFFPGEHEGGHPPPQMTRLGQTLFFVGDDRDSGPSVWRSDGTPSGSFQVPVAGYSGALTDPRIFGTAGGRLFWSAWVDADPARRMLLAADETGAGVALGKYGPQSFYFDHPVFVGARAFFLDCTDTGCQIGSSDGTPAGTGPVAALAGRFAQRDQDLLAAFAGRWLVFSAGLAVYAYDVVDGQVRTLLSETQYPRAYALGASLYLVDETGLWVSRLDAPQPLRLYKGPHPYVAGWRGDTLYFVPDDYVLRSTDGRSVHPYKGDYLENFSVLAEQLGTLGSRAILSLPGYYTEGVFAIDDEKRELQVVRRVCIYKNQCSSLPLSDVTVAGGQAFFTVNRRLFHSDGTPHGTRLHPVLGFADAESFRAFDGRLVLAANDKAGMSQLWSTDGGAAGTRALADGGSALPFHVEGAPERLGDALYAAASRKPVGQQLWRIADGHATAVTAQRHLASGIDPYLAFRAGSTWVVQGNAEPGWRGISAAGAAELLPRNVALCDDPWAPCPTAGLSIGRRYLFPAADSHELVATDGTAAGTRALPLEDPDGVASVVSSLGRFRDRALILGDAGGLWTSDGTAAGTRFVTQLPIAPAPANPGRGVGAPVAAGSFSFLFRRVPVPGDTTRSALELWRTDGTAAGTRRLMSVPFDKQASPDPAPTPLAGRLFFQVFGGLWVSDGSVAGTRPVPHQLPGGTWALIAGTRTLYVAAGSAAPDKPRTLWAIDPATLFATRLGAFRQITLGLGFPLGHVVDDTLVFFATGLDWRNAWRRTEGTPESTVPLAEPLASNLGAEFVILGDRRYFSACDVDHGCELWSTDRLGEDARLVQDVWAGPLSSYPDILGSDEHSLWFAATEPSVGRELWRLDLPTGGAVAAAGTRPSPSAFRAAPPTARARALRAKHAQEPPWKRRLR